MDLHGDALNKIVGDMDDMESKKMLPAASGGATITISIAPGTDSEPEEEGGESDNLPEDHDESMCNGGCAAHMASGGVVPAPMPQVAPDEDDMRLPPFLRKKRPM